MNGAMLDTKEHTRHDDTIGRYAQYDIVYVMLDKRIDHLSDEIKYVRDEIGKTNQRMDFLFAQTNKKIDELAIQTNQKIDTMAAQTNQRMDTLFAQTNQKIDALAAQTTQQMVSMKIWGIGLLVTVLLVVLAPHVLSLLG